MNRYPVDNFPMIAIRLFFITGCLLMVTPHARADDAARARVKAAIEYMRDRSSYSVSEMTIHRPSWERKSNIRVWTKGLNRTLVRFIAPAKDFGNGSLTIDEEMWSFTPKTNRIIRIPPSMKSQNWMGSDFSYQDLSKGDDIIDQYEHTEIGSEKIGADTAHVIQSIPKESAPVVWGKEILKIRGDGIVLSHEFYDQDMKLVKKLTASDLKITSGKLYATLLHMENVEKKDEWTEVKTLEAHFGVQLKDELFTQSYLSNPRADESFSVEQARER
jgi:outer membrane lipoprotein-sorting protein